MHGHTEAIILKNNILLSKNNIVLQHTEDRKKGVSRATRQQKLQQMKGMETRVCVKFSNPASPFHPLPCLSLSANCRSRAPNASQDVVSVRHQPSTSEQQLFASCRSPSVSAAIIVSVKDFPQNVG